MLEFKDVTKTFNKLTTAITDLSFKVDDGEFVFISGPSGAGKTTILRLILRDTMPDTGQILIDGKDVTKLKGREIPLLRQSIGTVFQDFKIIKERSVRENVEVALEIINTPFKEWRDRVNHVLELVGLSGKGEFFPIQLSGGELQRASLARALVVNPKIILADEPTGNLDWETSNHLMELFEKINKEGKTIIMATHNEMIIDKMKKRVLKINDGRLAGKEEAGKKSKK